MKRFTTGLALVLGLIASGLLTGGAAAEEIGCVTTAWKLIGANHKVCVDAFDDPKIPGVACHLSQARTGGIAGSLGLATDPSRFAIACRQVGPITMPPALKENETVFTEDTSILFKETRVIRMFDRKRNTLVYLVYSTKLIDGSPMNSISTVPIMPWR
ncbi:MAG: CreA family protein [Rhodospirillaceae bacterium]